MPRQYAQHNTGGELVGAAQARGHYEQASMCFSTPVADLFIFPVRWKLSFRVFWLFLSVGDIVRRKGNAA